VGAAAIVVLFGAPSAHAGPLVASATSCDDQVLETPFTQWADPANYVLAPNGTAEKRARWTLEGGAVPVLGNESYYVHAKGERYSLELPPGSSATTASMCVGIEHPTVRFFARQTSGPFLGTLRVEVVFEDAAGTVRSLPIGQVSAGLNWTVTPVYPVVVNLLPLLPGAHTAVAFRLTPQSGTSWQIDDLYVDPWGSR
jgi:hypothetical protein